MAGRTGLTPRALRFWEEKGLLPAPPRSDGGMRLYSEADVARVERIRDLKEVMGLSLDVIRELLDAEEEVADLRRQAHQFPSTAERVPYMERAAAILEQQVRLMADRSARINHLKGSYEHQLERLRQRMQHLVAPVTREEDHA